MHRVDQGLAAGVRAASRGGERRASVEQVSAAVAAGGDVPRFQGAAEQRAVPRAGQLKEAYPVVLRRRLAAVAVPVAAAAVRRDVAVEAVQQAAGAVPADVAEPQGGEVPQEQPMAEPNQLAGAAWVRKGFARVAPRSMWSEPGAPVWLSVAALEGQESAIPAIRELTKLCRPEDARSQGGPEGARPELPGRRAQQRAHRRMSSAFAGWAAKSERRRPEDAKADVRKSPLELTELESPRRRDCVTPVPPEQLWSHRPVSRAGSAGSGLATVGKCEAASPQPA